MRHGFQRRVVVDEALRNLRAAPVRLLLTAVLAMALGTAAAACSALDVAAVERAWRDQRAAGSSTWEIRAPWTDGLSASRCDALRTVAGVRTAGGMLGTATWLPQTAPDTRVPGRVVTPGFPALVWPEDPGVPGRAVVAGESIAGELGWAAGTLTSLTEAVSTVDGATSPGSLLRIDAVGTGTTRFEGMDRALLVTSAPSGSVDTCYVEAVPGAAAGVAEVLADWFEPDEGAIPVPFWSPGPLDRDPEAELRTRPSRWVPLAAGLVLAGCTGVTWWARRTDVAVYRMLGMSRWQVLRMVSVEVVLSVLVPCQVGVAGLVVVLASSGVSGSVARAVLLDDARLLLVLAVAPLVALVAGTALTAWDALRGR